MTDNEHLKQTDKDVNSNIEFDNQIKKLQQELRKASENYNLIMKFMAADAPIEVLCLDKTTENKLIHYGFCRIYDLFYGDLTKVKGLGPVRMRHLTACLNEFLGVT